MYIKTDLIPPTSNDMVQFPQKYYFDNFSGGLAIPPVTLAKWWMMPNWGKVRCYYWQYEQTVIFPNGATHFNKANLMDLIAATGQVFLLKLDSNRRFFSLCDLEIWWMTPKNNRASLLCYFKLFASFRSHWWIQTTVRKRLILVQIDDLFSRVTLQFGGWPWKTIGHLFYATSSFVHHSVVIGEFKLELQSGNA